MALRAGYYGVKKNVLATIAAMAGAKIIKTIGDGLKLTSAGKLSCDIDTSTMEFKSGKLAAKGSSFNYSYDEVNTGQKWVDGSDIYCKVVPMYSGGSLAEGWTSAGNNLYTSDSLPDAAAVADVYALRRQSGGFTTKACGGGVVEFNPSNKNVFYNVTLTYDTDLVIFYTKSAS